MLSVLTAHLDVGCTIPQLCTLRLPFSLSVLGMVGMVRKGDLVSSHLAGVGKEEKNK
jgi:hypothetical protein